MAVLIERNSGSVCFFCSGMYSSILATGLQLMFSDICRGRYRKTHEGLFHFEKYGND